MYHNIFIHSPHLRTLQVNMWTFNNWQWSILWSETFSRFSLFLESSVFSNSFDSTGKSACWRQFSDRARNNGLDFSCLLLFSLSRLFTSG